MTTENIDIMSKEEIAENITADKVHFDVALRSRMERLERLIKELSAEYDAVKDVAKVVFGENGGNKVFHTETTISYILNTKELESLIGADKVKALKNKPRKSTSVKW